MMKEDRRNEELKEEELRKERLDEEARAGIAEDWADLASQELADYIEEQGIQIRY